MQKYDFQKWLYAVLAINTAVFLAVFIIGQQLLHRAGNEPQRQVALEYAQAVERRDGWVFAEQKQFDLRNSAEVFHVLYNDRLEPVIGTGLLNGQLPALPQDVVSEVEERGEVAIAWRPEAGMKHALVVRRINGAVTGYVSVGRSSAATDQQVARYGLSVLIGWLLAQSSAVALHVFAKKRFS